MKHFLVFGIACVLVFPAVVGAQGEAFALPDPGALPDSPFYFLKSWREGVQLFFTFNAEKKAEQYLHLAEVRLAEYEKMLEKALRPAQGESAERTQAKYEQIAERTLEKYENQLERALTKAEELKAEGDVVADELKREVEETATKHLKVLERNLEKVSESAKQGIERALEASKKQLEKLDDIFGDEFDDLFEDIDEDNMEDMDIDDVDADDDDEVEELNDLLDDTGLEDELDSLLEGLE